MDPESAIIHAASSPDTPDRLSLSSLRQQQSHEAYHDNDSGSLITSTRPPSNFDHPSFESNPPAVETKRHSSSGNDHNIWGDSDRKNHGSFSRSPVESDEGGIDDEQPISPGQYFGARSLPLASMDELWQPPVPLSTMSAPRSGSQRSSSLPSFVHTDPLWKRFKALPSTLHHRHQWQRHVSGLHSNSEAASSLSSSGGPFYSLVPSDASLTLEQVHDTPMTLSNHHSALALSYSFFSAHGNVTFDRQAGTLEPGHTTSVRLKPAHPLPADQDEQVVLVLVLGTHQTVHRISIQWASHHDHDPCPFCVLESLYPLENSS